MISLQEPANKKAFTPATEKLFSAIPGIENASGVAVLHADELEEDEFTKHWVNKNRACLIKGAVAHWPAVRKWKEKSYWLSQLDNFQIDVFPHENFNTPEFHDKGREVMNFHDAIERLYARRDPIFNMPSKEINRSSHFEPLKAEMKGFKFLPNPGLPRAYPRMRIFIYRGASTAWHYHDADETLMCQVNGAKKVAILPPSIPRVREVAEFLKSEQYLKGKSLDPSLKLNPSIVEVGEGDALYIPPYWFHAVVPVDQEIGQTLAFCWKSPWHKIGNFSSYFVRKLYKTAFWPFNLYTLFLPFLAVYAGTSFLVGKLFKRI
jgi:hypothetical protein